MSRSDKELLAAFEHSEYPNGIGPGVYDIHSPNMPTQANMVHLLQQAARHIPAQRLWVNPDCGLKTRGVEETTQSLKNLVTAAKNVRKQFV